MIALHSILFYFVCIVDDILWEHNCVYEEVTIQEFCEWLAGGVTQQNHLQKYPPEDFWAYFDYKHMGAMFAEDAQILQVCRLILTLLGLKLEHHYSLKCRSIPWLLIPWLLVIITKIKQALKRKGGYLWRPPCCGWQRLCLLFLEWQPYPRPAIVVDHGAYLFRFRNKRQYQRTTRARINSWIELELIINSIQFSMNWIGIELKDFELELNWNWKPELIGIDQFNQFIFNSTPHFTRSNIFCIPYFGNCSVTSNPM